MRPFELSLVVIIIIIFVFKKIKWSKRKEEIFASLNNRFTSFFRKIQIVLIIDTNITKLWNCWCILWTSVNASSPSPLFINLTIFFYQPWEFQMLLIFDIAYTLVALNSEYYYFPFNVIVTCFLGGEEGGILYRKSIIR